MNKTLKILFPLFLMAQMILSMPVHAQRGGGLRELREEAQSIFKGETSPGELRKWEKRLQRFKSHDKWPAVVFAYNVIGVWHLRQGNLDDALKNLEESVRIAREKGPERFLAGSLFWLGNVYKQQGQVKKALQAYHESLELSRRHDISSLTGRNARSIASILIKQGRIKEAMEYTDTILEMAEETQDNNLMLQFFHGIGELNRKQGHFDKSREYLTRALKKSKESKIDMWTAKILMSLGDLCFTQGDVAGAERRYEEAKTLLAGLKMNMGLANIHFKMGRMAQRKGDFEHGLKSLTTARDLARDIGMKPLEGNASRNMSMIYARKGEWQKALENINEAIEILREVEIPDQLQDCLFKKGLYQEKVKDMSGAEKSYRESVDILNTMRENLTGEGDATLASTQDKDRVYQRLIDLLMRQGKSSEGLKYIEQSRTKKLRDDFDQIKPEMGDKNEEKASEKEREMREEIEETRVQLTEEKSKPKEDQDTKKIAELEKTLEEKRQGYIEYINDLREKFPDLASLLAIQPDTLIDLQGLLPPKAAIIQYLILEERLYIFLVTRDSLSHKEVEVSQADLEAKIDYLRSLLMNPQIPSNIGPMEVGTMKPVDEERAGLYDMFILPFIETSEALYDTLLQPIEKEIESFKVLGLIPNGKLHLLPFQAVGKRDEKGSFRFLIENKSLFQLNSQSILKFAQKQAHAIGDQGKLIAFGNPDNSLKFAEEEITLIKEYFKKSSTFIQKDASEDKVKRNIKGFDILHLATHGKMAGNIKESYILLSPSADGREDGKLFLREIWGLPLRGYQLVTLSACETAKGKEASGDVMVSLETAFLRAGTPTILASLWEVDDAATGLFMKTFYQNLKSQGKAEALRGAQIALMKNPQFAFPYFWAPFILVGDWR